MRLSHCPLLLVVFFYTCGPAPLEAQLPYVVEQPELLAELPDDLAEISGLSVRGNVLLAVQDEDGVIFRIDRATGAVLDQLEFWEEGDYEGIELVGDVIWVVKSNGNLYQIVGAGTDAQRVSVHKTWLKGENNVEGLCYDAGGHRLLLACKDDPKGNGLDKGNRYIFAYDLEKNELLKDPAITIRRPKDFSPSALAVHPQTGQLYLTSSKGKQLLVTSPSGDIIVRVNLDPNYFPQPEGLTFAADGTLYISTEAGAGQPARIYRLPCLK